MRRIWAGHLVVHFAAKCASRCVYPLRLAVAGVVHVVDGGHERCRSGRACREIRKVWAVGSAKGGSMPA